MNPGNFVNNLDTDYLIHIEQSLALATTHPTKVARALATWFTTYAFE